MRLWGVVLDRGNGKGGEGGEIYTKAGVRKECTVWALLVAIEVMRCVM